MLGPMEFRILEDEITYTGRELRPHWGLERTKVYGSLLTAFVGPCAVPTEHLVDLEDRIANDHIQARQMLHVIGEFFGITLEAGVLYQRLFMVWVEKKLRDTGMKVDRRGDDLFVGDGKLSVSIATASPVSVLLHWGLNVDATGAPVRTASLSELGWKKPEVLAFAKKLMSDYLEELKEIRIAQCKVQPVGPAAPR